MDERITLRVSELRREFETGQRKLGQLEVEENYLRERLLMLKGAITVLEDLLTEPADDQLAAELQAVSATLDGASLSRE